MNSVRVENNRVAHNFYQASLVRVRNNRVLFRFSPAKITRVVSFRVRTTENSTTRSRV